jgi:hypothetical protein
LQHPALNQLTLTLAPGYPHLHAIKSLHLDKLADFGQTCTAILRQCLRAGSVYRDKIRGHMLTSAALAHAQKKNCTRIGKKRVMLRSLRLRWSRGHSQDSLTASIRLSTVYLFYCRAVSVNGIPTRNRVLYHDFAPQIR